MPDPDLTLGLAVALAVGILIGLERERRKGSGPGRGPAGVRTFALTGLAGGIAFAVGGEAVAAVALGFVGAAALLAYLRDHDDDPGLTTEVAMVVVFLLGALCVNEPVLGAGLGVAVTVMLAAREEMHRFARSVITEDELHDLLLLAAAATIVLPLLPNEPLGPYETLNPFEIWRLVVLVMAIGGAGYVAVRLAGARAGLPLAGLAGGFVSSAATIGSMGSLARRVPALARPAAAGAVLSTVATFIQMAVVVGATSGPTLERMAAPLLAGGMAAVLFGAVAVLRMPALDPDSDHAPPGRPFSIKGAVAFAAAVSAIMVLAATLNDLAGSGGALLSAGLGGFADAHAGGASVGSLVDRGAISVDTGTLGVLVALSTNSITKIVVAASSGGVRFAADVGLGVGVVLAITWAAALAEVAA